MTRAWKPSVGLIACVAVFLAARSIASYGGGHLVYVTHGTGTSVAALDTATRAVVQAATLIPQPYGIAISPDGERAYITARGNNSLYIIRTSDHQVEHAVAVGYGPYGVAISPDGLRAYVANGGENSLTVVDTPSSAVVATVPVGLLPYGVAISPDGTRVYVSVVGADAIAVVDALTNEVAAHIPVGNNPRDVVVSPDGARLYSANQFSSTVSVVDTAAGVVIATIEVGSNPHSLAQTRDGRLLYVSHHQPDGTVSVIDTVTNRAVGLVTGVGAYPVGLAVDGEYGYVAVSSTYDVAVFDLETNAIVQRIATGENPISVAVTPRPPNEAPAAMADLYLVSRDGRLAVDAPGVIGNDYDADGQPLTAVVEAGPSHGQVRLNADGSFIFEPFPGYVGPDSFSYHVNDGRADSTSAAVTLHVISAGGPYTASEGTPVVVTASGGKATMAYEWDLDANGSFETAGQSATFFAADGDRVAPIAVRVTDAGGAVADAWTTVGISNVGPVADPIVWNISVEPVRIGDEITATAGFRDVGVADTHTGTFDWGDGMSSPAAVTEENGAGSASASHSYTATGLYTVTLALTDKDGASVHSVFKSVVVNNPEGSYEYGAGSFKSPPGAYTADPTLAGTAYVTQLYARHAAQGTLTYPSNAFRFSYLPARLNFASTSMKSLVISGNRSWLRGEGITFVGLTREPCDYLLAVVDSFTSPDKVRVKITSKVTGQVVYDNQKGAPDDAEATGPTSGPGTVVIVKK
jgi:YVTN family beta-propeller protein